MREIKIKRIEIYGFGKWTDSTFDFTDQLFISLYGENEAGKSTLQQFIMYMLFGLSPRKLKQFKPKNSNKLGGKLTITHEEIGDYTIERNENTVNCLLADGQVEGVEWLTKQLGGLTREIYESIYTFSALDLEDIQKMDETQLSDVLFSVGLTGATNIYKLEKQLDTKMSELFRPQARVLKINKQLNELDGIHQQIHRFKENEATYRTMVIEKQLTAEKIERYQHQILQLKQEKVKYEKIEHLLPSIRDFYVAEERLSKLPSEIKFPEDGITRFETNKNKLLPLIHKQATLENELARNETEVIMQSSKLLPTDVKTFAEKLLGEKQSASERQLEINQLTKQLTSLESEVNQLLTDVELEESYLYDVSLPFHLEQTWHEISEESREITLETQRLAEAQHLAKQENMRLMDEVNTINSELHSSEEIDLMKVEIFNYENTASNINQHEVESNAFSTWKMQRKNTAKYALIGFSSVAMLLFLVGIFTKPALFITLAILLLIIGVGQYYFLKHSTESLAKLANTQTISQPTITKQQYIHNKQFVKRQEELLSHMKINDNDLLRNTNDTMQLAEKQRLLEQTKLNHNINRHQELNRYPFLDGLEPSHWIELLTIMRRAKQLILDKYVLINTIKELGKLQSDFFERLKRLGEMLHVDPSNITIQYIENILNDERGNRHLLDQLLSSKQRNETEIRGVTSEFKLYKAEQAALFNFAGVENEEAYFKLSQKLAEQRGLLVDQEKFMKQMKITFDAMTVEDIVTKKMNLQGISFEVTAMDETLKSLEAELIELTKTVARLEIEISQLESSDDYSKATYEFQMKKDKLAIDSEAWAVLKVMQTVLLETKKTYQERYLVEVITYTTQYFTQMTNGSYVKIYSPTEDRGFQVETENQVRFNVEELSQGTINQLYVSLRLAISKAMSNKYVVPLIIDDAFVHFDEVRMMESIKILQSIAKEQQVFLFTCRNSIAKQTNAIDIANTILV